MAMVSSDANPRRRSGAAKSLGVPGRDWRSGSNGEWNASEKSIRRMLGAGPHRPHMRTTVGEETRYFG
jgi:hypothetical protein